MCVCEGRVWICEGVCVCVSYIVYVQTFICIIIIMNNNNITINTNNNK